MLSDSRHAEMVRTDANVTAVKDHNDRLKGTVKLASESMCDDMILKVGYVCVWVRVYVCV